MKVKLIRKNNAVYLQGTGVSNIPVNIDGSEDIGGTNAGARPMELILMGLGSCGAMDILSILKKQRQEIEHFEIEIDSTRDYDQTPAIFTNIDIVFLLYGNLDEQKVQKAVDLSMQKYCSVSAMLQEKVDIKYSFKILNGTKNDNIR